MKKNIKSMSLSETLYNFLMDYIITNGYITTGKYYIHWVHREESHIQIETNMPPLPSSVWTSISFDVEIIKYFPNLYHIGFNPIVQKCLIDLINKK